MTLEDNTQFRRLAEQYARAVDRRSTAELQEVMTSDAVIEGPGFRLAGMDEILSIPTMLEERFRATRHLIHNQIIDVDGDNATGETWCTASHLQKDVDEVLVWHIRYQESLRCDEGAWRFAGRRIVIDWTEVSPVSVGP